MDALTNRTNSGATGVPRAGGRRPWAAWFFLAWTVFAALAVWWLLRRGATGYNNSSWVMGDGLAKMSLVERAGNWFKLADLNFHRVYPWVLLAPYVVWFGSRFRMERDQWRLAWPAHLAGGALFAVACGTLAAHDGWKTRHVIISYGIRTTSISDGVETSRTNKFVIQTTGPLSALPELSAELQKPLADLLPDGPDGPPGEHSFFLRRNATESFSDLLNVLAYASLVGIAHAFHFQRRLKDREQRALLLESQLTKERLHALQARLHPHFLFNALNGISTLLRRDPRAAQDALASFSELLRLALNQSDQPEVLLRDDLDFLHRYVEVQQMRLGDRLRFEPVIAENLADCLVPALFLQPLVENAIRHGVEPSPHPGVVRVVLQSQSDRLLLTVEDNGVGLSAPKTTASGGIGLENLRARLKSLYGDQQRVEFGARPEGGVVVRVEIPLRRRPGTDALPPATFSDPKKVSRAEPAAVP